MFTLCSDSYLINHQTILCFVLIIALTYQYFIKSLITFLCILHFSWNCSILFRGDEYDAAMEISQIIVRNDILSLTTFLQYSLKAVLSKHKHKVSALASLDNFLSVAEDDFHPQDLLTPSVLKPFLVTLVLMFLLQLSGQGAVTFYTGLIFQVILFLCPLSFSNNKTQRSSRSEVSYHYKGLSEANNLMIDRIILTSDLIHSLLILIYSIQALLCNYAFNQFLIFIMLYNHDWIKKFGLIHLAVQSWLN